MLEMFEDLTTEERKWLVEAPMRLCYPQSATIPYTHFGIGPEQTFGNNLKDLAWRVDAKCGDIEHFPKDVVRLLGRSSNLVSIQTSTTGRRWKRKRRTTRTKDLCLLG